jgi:DNA (cytosine-5)-methyltransferase 1
MKKEIRQLVKIERLLEVLRPVVESSAPFGEGSAIITHWASNPKTHTPLMNEMLMGLVLETLSKNDIRPPVPKLNQQLIKQEVTETWIDWSEIPYTHPSDSSFTFIDLFAGIGGIRIAMQASGGRCVFSSEWDSSAQKTYFSNFGEVPYGDIRNIPKSEIPDHDVLCAGFPCQPFSLAGVSKKNSLGRKHGFEDLTQGTLFFEIKEILREKKPKAFLLENVKNLVSHDNGKTFSIIMQTLEEQLGYVVHWAIVDGANWVPQHRERIYIVGFDPAQINIRKEDILIPLHPENGYRKPKLADIIQPNVKGHTLGNGTWNALLRHRDRHSKKGNGFGFALINTPIADDEVTRTISARYHKDGAEILIEQPGDYPRRLTVHEAMQLQGFDPERFIFPVSRTQAYKQIGNSVVIPAISSTARNIADVLASQSMLEM